jgi:RNA polymerase-binding transcription factor DksA
MRHHFHRCGYLRLLEVDASDLNRVRKGGGQILEELCEAKRLARCVGLAECDILSPAQKRALLVARATRLREEEPAPAWLAAPATPRDAELAALRADLEEEYQAMIEENRSRKGEAGGALQRNPRPFPSHHEADLAVVGASVILDDELRELRMARLDALERAIEAIDRGRYGNCARCRGPIEIDRLREAPGAVVCTPCEQAVWPDRDRPVWAEEPPAAPPRAR